MVSPADGLLATRVVYDPPVRVLRFPVSAGDTWSDTSTVTGVVSGVPSFYTEAYETVADVQGRAMTPYGEFDALRLRVTLTRTVGVLPTVTRSVLLLAECFGTVVRVTSDMGEAQAEFGHAAEVARLAQ